MPAPAGDAEARAKLKTADQAAKQAIKDHAAREADLITASDTLERSSEDAEEAGTSLGDALIELRLVLQDATLDVADENLLAPLASASDDATEALKAQSERQTSWPSGLRVPQRQSKPSASKPNKNPLGSVIAK